MLITNKTCKLTKMKKYSLLLLVTLIIVSNSIAQETNLLKNINNMVLEYSDGNGNFYKITKDSISYHPISKEMSSSGLYDGGKPVKNEIMQKDFNKVYLEFEAIFENKRVQIPNRIKTSGLIIMQEEGVDKKVVMIKKSVEKKQLESILKRLLE